MRRQRRFNFDRSQARHGLTILEVLMAIGVAIIGLFGVWAMIPVAGQKVERSLLEDDKSAFGRSAFRDFDVRGMRQPENWLIFREPFDPNSPPDSLTTVDRQQLSGLSFCIDPHLIADSIAVNQGNLVATFPAQSLNPKISMARVTLRANPYSPLPALNVPPIVPPSFAVNQLMARKMVQTVDDLIVSQQDDETLPPQQEYLRVDPDDQTSAALLRAARGDLSWLATLVPSWSGSTNKYLMSVVVFNRRDVAADITEQEFVYDVLPPSPPTYPGFPGAGYGGGDVVLSAGQVEFQQNDWVLLARYNPTPPGLPPPEFSWYRVIATDPDEANGLTSVTLEGRDWDATVPTQCIFVKDVVAVYEKTIHLETSSLWKTQ